ncbi:unnamed protein product [Blepharisma stoltei]|uniref:RING-type domain-containing protein n=1 Tax=Blepharisma stoltei TaxID=1481888 RepID=A0AAU9JEK6_9CILI|nr:unnamed protein product [Blepharisma stoltei]
MNDHNPQMYVEIVEPDLEDSMRSLESYKFEDLSLKEGYEVSRFVETPRKDILCPICLGVAREPLECIQCGILICKKCANMMAHSTNRYLPQPRYMEKPRLTCPVCRSKAAPREPSLLLIKYINSLKIYCKNRSQGCPEICALENIKQHQKICQFSTICCANQQFCNRKGSKSDFITVNFPKPRIASYFNNSRIRKKDKVVCSEACKKLLLMKHALDSGQVNEALSMYHTAINELVSPRSK